MKMPGIILLYGIQKKLNTDAYRYVQNKIRLSQKLTLQPKINYVFCMEKVMCLDNGPVGKIVI